jgi:hypothetical protein
MKRTAKRTGGLVGSLAAFLMSTSALAQSPPPALGITLKPHLSDGKGDYIDVRVSIAHPDVKAGQTLVHLPLMIVSMPGITLEAKDLSVADAKGTVAITQADQPTTPQWQYRDFKPARDTEGDVTLSYRAYVREVSGTTRIGPLFDLRGQPGGVNGAGMTFLALPDTKTPYSVTLKWDMSALPAGAMGVHSLGEGDVKTIAPVDLWNFSYYYAGTVETYKADRFTMYWTKAPPFDTRLIAQKIGTLYDNMTRFFDDTSGSSYRVFVRENPFSGTGGTALASSFMFGYDVSNPPTTDKLQGLLAHEMAHNWLKIGGEHGDTAWYTEGTAEYYSIVLAARSGLLTPAQVADMMNDRAFSYWSNPLSALSNADAAKAFWKDNSAQTIPYGRGLLYLINTDANIRAASAGKRNLDTVVKAMIAKQKARENAGIDEWLQLVGADIGAAKARADYEDMVAGKPILPVTGALGDCFTLAPATVKAFELGFEQASLNKNVVSGVKPGTAAAKAGLKDGDAIIESTSVFDAMRTQSSLMKLKVRRADQVIDISYLPRVDTATKVSQWQRKPGVADAACKL